MSKHQSKGNDRYIEGSINLQTSQTISSISLTPLENGPQIHVFFRVPIDKERLSQLFLSSGISRDIASFDDTKRLITHIHSCYKRANSPVETLNHTLTFFKEIAKLMPDDDQGKLQLNCLVGTLEAVPSKNEAIIKSCISLINTLINANRQNPFSGLKSDIKTTKLSEITQVVDYCLLNWHLSEYKRNRPRPPKVLSFFSPTHKNRDRIEKAENAAIDAFKESVVSVTTISDDDFSILRQGDLGKALSLFAQTAGYSSVDVVLNKLKFDLPILKEQAELPINPRV